MQFQPPPPFHFALTGYPLGHSRSPAIHNAALAACLLEGEYILRPIPPDHIQVGLGQLVSDLRKGAIHGFNVTIPHKQAILDFCDVLTPAATAMGAANLVYKQDSQIIGDNSDAPGFMAALIPYQDRWKGTARRAIVLGAGGSARAVVYALVSSGWYVQLAARRQQQAIELAINLAGGIYQDNILAIDLPAGLSGAGADLLVNTTPLGMHPNPDGCPWPDGLAFPEQAVVYDLVYNPRETTLLKRAGAAGLPTIGGIQMLVEQAAIAFERWTGRSAPLQAMFNSVI